MIDCIARCLGCWNTQQTPEEKYPIVTDQDMIHNYNSHKKHPTPKPWERQDLQDVSLESETEEN